MTAIPKTPKIPNDQITPVIAELLEIDQLQKELIQALKDEIAILKGEKPKPVIKPSKLESGEDEDKDGGKGEKNENGKRPGSKKRKKKKKDQGP